jgi:hypothetical protein
MTLDTIHLQEQQEQHIYLINPTTGKQVCKFDYRSMNGELFSCIRPTLEEAREACCDWLLSR